MKFIIFVKFLFKIEDSFELQNNMTYIFEFKNNQPFKIDEISWEDYQLIDLINDNENTNAISYFKEFSQKTVDFLEDFNFNKITVVELFENLKKLIINYNSEFKIRDKFKYDMYNVPKNFKEILESSCIQEEKNRQIESMIEVKKLENSMKFSVKESKIEVKQSEESEEESDKIIKTYKLLMKAQAPKHEESQSSRKYDLYYNTQQPVNNTQSNFIKKEYQREFKLKNNLIKKLLKEIKTKDANQAQQPIENYLDEFETSEIDFFDFNTKEKFFEIETLQIDNASLIIYQNNELYEEINDLENEIKNYEKKIKNIF